MRRLGSALAAMTIACAAHGQGALSQLGGPEAKAVAEGVQKLQSSLQAPRQLFALVEKAPKDDKTPDPKAPPKKKRQLMEVRADQLGQVYLMAAMVERGNGQRMTTNEQWGGNYNYVWYFQKAGERLQLMQKHVGHRAQAGTPESRMVAASIQDGVIASVAVVETDEKTGAILVDPQELFVKDLAGIVERIKSTLPQGPGQPFPVALIERESFLHSIVALPKNMEVSVQLAFSQPAQPARSGPASALTLRVRYSLVAMPDEPNFKPREADRRVGYYTSGYHDLSRADLRLRATPFVEHIERWHLEKSDPAAPVSDVKNPIVWWIDPSVPHRWREQVRAGILAWNEAFEAVGLRNALVVKDVEADMTAEERRSYDPADVSYNVVRWIVGEIGAEAPWRKNPLTGQIFNARIRVADIMGRLGGKLDLAAPRHEHGPGCDHTPELETAAAALAAAEALGTASPEELQKAMDQYMVKLIAHEAGHTLGLRHNFKARGPWSTDQLGFGDNDISTSFMHYVVPNIAAPGKPQGGYYQRRVGAYDRWAIEYGYKDASPEELKAIAARARGNPLLAFGGDEDATQGTDPDVQRWVLGRDPVDFARRQHALAEAVLERIQAAAPSGAAEQTALRDRYRAAQIAFSHGASAVLPLIGGVRARRDAEGSDPAFEAVTPEEQRAALRFLDEKVFNPKAFGLDPATVQRLAMEQPTWTPAQPAPIRRDVLAVQSRALAHIYNPATLGRLADSSLYAQRAVAPGEVMTTVRRSIWRELETRTPGSPDPMKRGLQNEHLKVLRALAKDERAPVDARAQARLDLSLIARAAQRAAKSERLDGLAKLHYAEMSRLAEDGLNEGRPPRSGTAVGR